MSKMFLNYSVLLTIAVVVFLTFWVWFSVKKMRKTRRDQGGNSLPVPPPRSRRPNADLIDL